MKKDILGREIKENDVVVVKGNHGCTMEVGVFVGKSVRTMNGPRHAEDVFLVENPGCKELAIKKNVLDKLAKEKAEAAVERAKKSAQKADVPGTIYLMSRDEEFFLYFGKCLVDNYLDGKLINQTEGHFYLSGGRWNRNPAVAVRAMIFKEFKEATQERMWTSHWPVSKSIKNYKEIYHTIEIPDRFVLENSWTSTSTNGDSIYRVMRQEVKVLK